MTIFERFQAPIFSPFSPFFCISCDAVGSTYGLNVQSSFNGSDTKENRIGKSQEGVVVFDEEDEEFGLVELIRTVVMLC